MTNDLEATSVGRGRRIGDYKVLRTISKGSSAEVWLARHLLTGTEVVVKAINQGSIARYFQEAHCLKCLNHPNITKLFEVITTDKQLFLVMEHVSGGDLLDYVRNCGPRTEKQAKPMFRQLISAVQYCHQKGITHRDLKPENILLDGERNLKVADFGFSRQFTDYKLTTFCGTVPYMAPEILKYKTYDGPKVDVWSLGVVLYTLLVGSLPFEEEDFVKTKKLILRGKFRVPRSLSLEGQNLLRKMLTLNPKNRPTLEEIMRDPWVSVGQKEVRPYSEPPWGDIDPQVAETMKDLGFQKQEIQESVTQRKYDRVMGTYLILKTTPKIGQTIRVKPYTSPGPTSHGSGKSTEEPPTPPLILVVKTTSLPCSGARTSFTSPAPQHGPGGSPTPHSICRRTHNTGGATEGTATANHLPEAQPSGGTPGSPSVHGPGRQGVRRAFRFCLKFFCCGLSTNRLRCNTRVSPL